MAICANPLQKIVFRVGVYCFAGSNDIYEVTLARGCQKIHSSISLLICKPGAYFLPGTPIAYAYLFAPWSFFFFFFSFFLEKGGEGGWRFKLHKPPHPLFFFRERREWDIPKRMKKKWKKKIPRKIICQVCDHISFFPKGRKKEGNGMWERGRRWGRRGGRNGSFGVWGGFEREREREKHSLMMIRENGVF